MVKYFNIFTLFLLLSLTSCHVRSVYKFETQTLIIIDSLGRDEKIVQSYLPYKRQIDSLMSEVIGFATTNLEKGQPESTLGNFFCDALLEYVKEYHHDMLENLPTMVLLNNGGFRTELKKGQITVGDIYRLMPFDNTIAILQLKGIDMQRLFNFIAGKGGMPIAGARLIFEANICTKAYINEFPLEENAIYNVITSNYLAAGGDGLNLLKDATRVTEVQVLLRDAFIIYLRKLQEKNIHIEGKKDGRIKYITNHE
ncbi:MAG: 5'-nucleotidase C-terminal domain-containing protein [Bacteroidales bacterium]|nr:5'-nucleotidase C-terminal domain-containing protein [Bacteroidales bacterium]